MGQVTHSLAPEPPFPVSLFPVSRFPFPCSLFPVPRSPFPQRAMTTYCDVAPGHEWHGPYHDREYGFPLRTDAELFERLILEINQAGLSWLTILKKRAAFQAAYRGFEPAVVARFGARDVKRLLHDAGIIRNRLKVEAAIDNARTLLRLRASHGSFHAWLAAHHPLGKEEWVRLFKQTFRFTGGEIVGEFLMSTGWLPGAHHEGCPVYRKVLRARPMWVGTDGKREKGSGKR